MSQINFEDETLDASDGVTKLLLAAEYWKEKASALRAELDALKRQEPVAWMKDQWSPDCGIYWELCREDEMGWRDRKDRVPLYLAPGAQPAQKEVAYLDLGTGGYMDIGTDLSDEQLASLPKGRHMLGIVGTYGVDGYVPAQPAPSFADAYQGAMEDVAIWKKRALEAEDLNRKFVAEINGPAYTCEPAQPSPSVPEGFSREELEAVAAGLDTYEKTVNVGNVTGEGDDHLESTTAYAARFIRAMLTVSPEVKL